MGKLVDEINVLSRKLAEAESRLKNEVEVIKKKMSITITELEMSLDASNKSNAQLQNTCKVQNEKIMQLTSAYEDVNRKLGASVQQYDVTIKKLTELDVSYMKITADYNDIARELKLADDRANKAGSDAHHFESLLREEQAKLVKIDQAKKSLENEVRSLSVRIEEIETNSVATSKRSIKELILQSEEDRKNIIILQDSLDKLNEKIKMYKRQLEEQESISNSNIMRVKKFQRELESAENRAEEAESTLNQFRSRERVFASASARSEKVQDIQESEVVVKKTINKVNISGGASSSLAITSSSSRDIRAGSVAGAVSYSRAGSVAYSRAGSVARAGSTFRASSMARGGSMSRAGSVLRY